MPDLLGVLDQLFRPSEDDGFRSGRTAAAPAGLTWTFRAMSRARGQLNGSPAAWFAKVEIMGHGADGVMNAISIRGKFTSGAGLEYT